MKFQDLRPEIQEIAAHALRHHIQSGYYKDGDGVSVAKDIQKAFVALFEQGDDALKED